MTTSIMNAVVMELSLRGIAASVQYPGAIWADTELSTLVGSDINQTTFDVEIHDRADWGEMPHLVTSEIPSDSTDVRLIASFFEKAYREVAALDALAEASRQLSEGQLQARLK